MREILFRGKRLDNGAWVDGFYCRYGYTGNEKIYIIPDYASALYAFEVGPSTVGQYTGLMDKVGKKIFEGDVLDENGYRFLVVFNQKWAKFKLQHDNKAIQYPEWNRGVQMKIIGNIHDNPEYLGGVHPEPPKDPAP